MPYMCCVPNCKGNYKTGPKVSIYNFPESNDLRIRWIGAIRRKVFEPTKSSKVCELHFEPSQILREASAFDPKTGRTLTARLAIPRLRKGAVPTLFIPPAGTPAKTRTGPKKLQKIQPKEELVKAVAEKTDESQLAELLQADLGTEYQNVPETSCVIKQEPDESVDEPPPLVIGKVLYAEELLSSSYISSSSSSSPSTSSIPPFSRSPPVSENALPIVNPDSTNLDQILVTHISNKPAQKRKINNPEPDANDASLDAAQAKLCRRAIPSMLSKRNSKLHPPAGTSKKSSGSSTLPTKNGENATREMFQSLVDGSENNPLFGSRTTERPGDLFDVFADFIAEKLREMDFDDCAYALRAILDVVFKAGKVQHDSEPGRDISSLHTSSGS